jgi:hypothetical protein
MELVSALWMVSLMLAHNLSLLNRSRLKYFEGLGFDHFYMVVHVVLLRMITPRYFT